MERVSLDEIESGVSETGVERHGLTEPLGTGDVAISRYRLDPGERLGSLHAHLDQEEVFVVTEGEATFETLSGEVTVEADEAIRFAPGEFQAGTNDSIRTVTMYALGAPRETEAIRIPLSCEVCGHDSVRPGTAEESETPVLVCPDCGAESETACSACGNDDKRVVLADDGETPLDICPDCGLERRV